MYYRSIPFNWSCVICLSTQLELPCYVPKIILSFAIGYVCDGLLWTNTENVSLVKYDFFRHRDCYVFTAIISNRFSFIGAFHPIIALFLFMYCMKILASYGTTIPQIAQ